MKKKKPLLAIVDFFIMKKYFIKYTQWHSGHRGVNPDWCGNFIIKAKNIESAMEIAEEKINTYAYSGVIEDMKKCC